MTLHPRLQQLLESKREFNPKSLWDTPIPELRQLTHDFYGPNVAGPYIDVHKIMELDLATDHGPINCRVYIPGEKAGRPVMIFYHGGGWVSGDLDTHDTLCRRLANTSGAIVVSVDYRLAPESPFPAALEDAYAVLSSIQVHAEKMGGDPERLIVAGDSAGGQLAAVVSQMARDQKGPEIAAQVLIYPGTDLTGSLLDRDFSEEEVLVTPEEAEWYFNMYCGKEANKKDPRLSPYQATDLSNLPPAIIITAEYDVIRHDGEKYGEKLKAAGNHVFMKRYPEMLHCFLQMTGLVAESHEAIDEIATELKKLL